MRKFLPLRCQPNHQATSTVRPGYSRIARILYLLALAIIFELPLSVHAADQELDYSQDLATVRSHISQLRKESLQSGQERPKLLEQLSELEQQIASIEKQRQDTEKKIANQSTTYQELRKKKYHQILELEKQSADLETIIQASFAVSRLNYVKVLLSEDNPSRLSRTITYYRYLSKSRAKKIEDLILLVQELKDTESGLGNSQTTLANLSSEFSDQHKQLRNVRKLLDELMNQSVQ